MKSFKEYLSESTILTGALVQQGMMEGYVNLFYSTLSKVTKGYKKEKDASLYALSGCGEVFDPTTKGKVVDKRPFYKLTNQILTHYGKVFYILEMDVDSSNALTMYREYKDKSKLEKYRLVMLAKKNIMKALKEAGFSVRSDKRSIYASLKDYVKNPDEDNGLVAMNYHQRELLGVCKKLFAYDGVQPAFNMYALTLKNVRALKDIADEGNGLSCPEGSLFDRAVVCTNGKIEFFTQSSDDEASLTLLGCFEPITKDQEEE